jgi:hypothetical protein
MATEEELAERRAKWRARHGQPLDVEQYEPDLVALIERIAAAENLSPDQVSRLVARYPRDGRELFAKDQLVRSYRELIARGTVTPSRETLARLRAKPTRTLSGVAPVTVLTKPFPCPGECIFCPEFSSMPKSYLPDEPGALRAEQLVDHRRPRLSAPWRTLAWPDRSNCSSSAGRGRPADYQVVHPPLPGRNEWRGFGSAQRAQRRMNRAASECRLVIGRGDP